MEQLTIIVIVVFCAVLFAVQGGYWLFAERIRVSGAVNRRLTLAKNNVNSQAVFDTLMRERGIAGIDNWKFANINDLVIQTGLRLDQKLVVAIAFSVSVIFFLLFGFLIGFGLAAFALSVISSGVSLFLFLAIVRRRRISKFAEQLPDGLDVIVRGVKIGYPFAISLGIVAKEMPDPIGTEFGLTSDEINFGLGIGQALDHLYRRVGHKDLLYMNMAIKIHSETGGNLAEILARLSRLIRERALLRMKVHSLTGEGRISAIFLSVFPFILFAIVSLISPAYYAGTLDSAIGVPAIVVGLLMMVIGNFIIYRMVNFRV